MKSLIGLSALFAAMLLGGCVVQAPPRTVVVAQPRPQQHPAYLHALSDLRAARWLIVNRPGDARVNADEDLALTNINDAINEVKRAAMEDGKDAEERPPVDARLDRRGRLHRADELLRQARTDLAREEDNGAARALRDRAIVHLDEAIRGTNLAIRDAANGL